MLAMHRQEEALGRKFGLHPGAAILGCRNVDKGNECATVKEKTTLWHKFVCSSDLVNQTNWSFKNKL